ncbi:MAG: hypothetical protein FWH11_12320 [Micrococcales bacterium]|nr:hypothetical protein [Micrococcales bacterium]
MSFAAVSGRPGGAGASAVEWWQAWAQRRARWLAGRPVLARRLRLGRTVVAWLAPVYLLVVVAVVPDARQGVRVWLGALWVVVAWFFAARTKTLTWSGLLRFFSACLVWSMATGAVLRAVSADVGGLLGVGLGAPTFVAGIGEEALKVVPVVVLAVAAPRRVCRFAAVDFVLLGLASGVAFEAVEEAVRRTWWVTTDNKGLAVLEAVGPDGLPVDWVHFGVWPIPTELVSTASWTGDPVVFAGHAMATALVAGVAGLGVVAWRSVRARSAAARVAVRAGALAVPVAVLVTMMSDHLACNARIQAGDAWLAAGSAVPWWLQVPWQWTGHAQYRPAAFVVLFVVCLAVDAFRLAARPGTNLVPGPAWRWVAQAGAGLSAWHARARWPGQAVASALNALLALVWIAGRDLGQAALAHTRDPGEPRLAAARRAAAAVSGQRTARELGMEHHAGQAHPWRARLLAAGLLAGLLVAALVLAPHLAQGTGPSMQGGWDWLAGLLDSVSRWWSSLSPGQQIAVGLGIALLVGASGGSLGLALGVSGVLTWGLDKSAGIATFVRDPGEATRSYFANATPGQLAADTLGVVLTFGPGNFAGATVGRGARAATRQIADNPRAWTAQTRQRIRTGGDEGAAQIPYGPRVPVTMDNCDQAAYQGVLHIRQEIIDEGGRGSHSWAKNWTDDEVAEYLHSYVTREEGWIMKDGTRGWYDEDASRFIVRRSDYSSSAYELPKKEFLKDAVEYVKF